MKKVSLLNQSKKFLLAIFGIFALIACKKVDASKGTPEDHIINETGFTAIEFSTGGNLTFSESASTSIIINTTDKVMNALDIHVKNSTLYVETKNRYNIKNSENIQVTIMAPNVNSLTCSGSGNLDANIDNTTEYSSFNLAVSGSGSLQVSAINSINQNISVSGSGSLTIDELTSENVAAKVSGSGGINIKTGTTINAKATISGSGNYVAFDLDTENTDVTVSGSGKAEVTANSTLDAVISGSGNVYYKGAPILNSSSTGSGDLINAN